MAERRSEEWYAEQGDGIERRCLCPFAEPDDDCTRPEEHDRPRTLPMRAAPNERTERLRRAVRRAYARDEEAERPRMACTKCDAPGFIRCSHD